MALAMANEVAHSQAQCLGYGLMKTPARAPMAQ